MASRKKSTGIDMHTYAKKRNVHEDASEASTSGLERNIVSSLQTHEICDTRYPAANLPIGYTYRILQKIKGCEASFQRGRSQQAENMPTVVDGRNVDVVTYDTPTTSTSTGKEGYRKRVDRGSSRLMDESVSTATNAPRNLTPPEKRKKYACSRCGRGPMRVCHLYAHYRDVHHMKEEEVEAIKKEIGRAFKENRSPIACNVCGGQFYSRNSLWVHKKKVHQLVSKGTITCPACSKKLHTVEELAMHCNSQHDRGNSAHGPFAVKSGTFASRDEFETWLNDIENITCSNFVTRTSRCTPQGKIVYLRCRFSGGSGAVVDPKVLKRAYRTSVKVHRDCPAFLKVVEDTNGFVHYKYCAGHLGHKLTTEALVTPASDIQHRRLLKLAPTEPIQHRQIVNDDVPEECETTLDSPPTFECCSSVDQLSRAEDEFNQLDAVVAQMLEEMKKSLKNNDPERIQVMRQAIEEKMEEISRRGTEAIPDRKVNLRRTAINFETREGFNAETS